MFRFTKKPSSGSHSQCLACTVHNTHATQVIQSAVTPTTPARHLYHHRTNLVILAKMSAGLHSGTHLHPESMYTHQMLCCRITTLTFTFLTNFTISDFNKEHMSSL